MGLASNIVSLIDDAVNLIDSAVGTVFFHKDRRLADDRCKALLLVTGGPDDPFHFGTAGSEVITEQMSKEQFGGAAVRKSPNAHRHKNMTTAAGPVEKRLLLPSVKALSNYRKNDLAAWNTGCKVNHLLIV